MTEKRKRLIEAMQSIINSNPREQILAATLANVAEDYCEEQIKTLQAMNEIQEYLQSRKIEATLIMGGQRDVVKMVYGGMNLEVKLMPEMTLQEFKESANEAYFNHLRDEYGRLTWESEFYKSQAKSVAQKIERNEPIFK